MTRLQKKCLIATAGSHLLVVMLVLCSGFIVSPPKPDETQVLTMISIKEINEALNSGVKDAQPPPPAPIIKPTEPAEPIPLPPQPQPKPVTPAPTLVQKVENLFRPEPDKSPPDDAKPADKPEKTVKPKHEVKPDLNPVVRSKPNVSDTSAADAARIKREREERANELRQIAQNLKNNFTPATVIDLPGDSSAAYANYASIVKSKYDAAWTPPDNAANDEANVKVSVTIANDGTVISAHIINKSGDSSVDDSVQRTLDRVTFIAPFPDGATDKQRTYIINFNLKAKRMLG